MKTSKIGLSAGLVAMLFAMPAAAFQYSLTLLHIQPDDSEVDDELFASAEALVDGKIGRFDWYLYVDAQVSPSNNGIANRVFQAAGEYGTALDAEGNGRVILAEAMIGTAVDEQTRIDVGVFSPASYLDSSRVSNDETSDFVGLPFYGVGNFVVPPYAPGVLVTYQQGDTGLKFALNSTGALGNSGGTTYSKLLDVAEDGEGLFSAVEWSQGWADGDVTRIGLWSSSAKLAPLDGVGPEESNWGAFINHDAAIGRWDSNWRLGWANPEVNAMAGFASAIFTRPLYDGRVGLAAAWSRASSDLNAAEENSYQLELNWRWAPVSWLLVTPNIQYIRDHDFGSDATLNRDQWLYGLRLSIEFDVSDGKATGLFGTDS